MRQPTFFMAFDYDYTGNSARLDRRKVAFFASRVVSPAVEEQTLRWVGACCATDRVVMSGFQSPLEKSVFEILLKARHPVIWALGRALYRRTGWQTVQTRNYTIATMAEESVYTLRSDSRPSSLDVLCGLELGRKPVRCFPQ